MFIINWLTDSPASDDVIDLNFILSDLVDINLTDAEIYETGSYDFLANAAVREYRGERKIPLGKQVL